MDQINRDHIHFDPKVKGDLMSPTNTKGNRQTACISSSHNRGSSLLSMRTKGATIVDKRGKKDLNGPTNIEPQPDKSNTSSSTLVSITQWNGRSIQNQTKINYAQNLPGDILVLQEIWQRTEQVQRIKYPLDIVMRDSERGGGTATIAETNTTRVVSRFSINKDTNAVKVKYQNQYMWIVNVYIHDGSTSKIQKLFGKIRQQIPNKEWKVTIVIGDFNIDAQDNNPNFILMKTICKSMGMMIYRPKENTTKESKVDYVIAGNMFTLKEHSEYNSVSDHKALNWVFNFKHPGKEAPSYIPDYKMADMLTLMALRDPKVKDSQDFLRYMKTQRNRNKIMKVAKRKKRSEDKLIQMLLTMDATDRISEILDDHWIKMWVKTEELRFSEESKEAYDTLRRILKYNLIGKQDGGIINQLTDDRGTSSAIKKK